MMAIDYRRASELLLVAQKAMTCDEAKRLNESVDKLMDALLGGTPFDWRYNATHWAENAASVCTEIGYSIAWMRAFAQYSSECDERGQWAAESRVSYYADNAATRISSCRDKIALLAWSYYCPFNPDKKHEVLTFDLVRERLSNPIRFGLKLDGPEALLAELNKLVGLDFERAATYRHKKIHRMEPRVMLHKPQTPDNPSYMFALTTEKEIQAFDEKLAEMYPNDRFREQIREGCFQDGVLFDRRAPDQLLWHFVDFDEFTYSCWKKLCDATAGCCDILLSREPLLSKERPGRAV
jgi:hypothetical protein